VIKPFMQTPASSSE